MNTIKASIFKQKLFATETDLFATLVLTMEKTVIYLRQRLQANAIIMEGKIIMRRRRN
jgi:hypothetical protein